MTGTLKVWKSLEEYRDALRDFDYSIIDSMSDRGSQYYFIKNTDLGIYNNYPVILSDEDIFQKIVDLMLTKNEKEGFPHQLFLKSDDTVKGDRCVGLDYYSDIPGSGIEVHENFPNYLKDKGSEEKIEFGAEVMFYWSPGPPELKKPNGKDLDMNHGIALGVAGLTDIIIHNKITAYLRNPDILHIPNS